MQPWEFIVVKTPEKKREIVSTTFTGYFAGEDNQQTWLNDAGFLLVLAANIKRTKARYGEAGSQYWPIIDATIAGEHAVLAATALGLGTRSEEHTSELQSRGHLVCRLLLEKK